MQACNPCARSFSHSYVLQYPSTVAHRDPIASGPFLFSFGVSPVVRGRRASPLLLCILWYIIYDLLCSDGCSAAAPPLPAVAAIAGAIAVLIAVYIMVAAGQTRIKAPSLPVFLPFAPPDQISPLSPFSLSCGLAPPLPPSSFHPPFSCFKVSTWICLFKF